MNEMSQVQISVGEPPFVIEAVALRCGDDWTVTVGGGERYHIGAAAVAYVMPSLKDPQRPTGTVSVLTVPGHKEDELARRAALTLAKKLQTTVAVTVGIHVEQATEEEIRRLISLFDRLIADLSAAMLD